MDPNINSETGETITSGRSPRFTLWTAYLVFSIIVMTSAIQVVRLPKILLFCFDFAFALVGFMLHNFVRHCCEIFLFVAHCVTTRIILTVLAIHNSDLRSTTHNMFTLHMMYPLTNIYFVVLCSKLLRKRIFSF